jgi:dienelactone hydrolase
MRSLNENHYRVQVFSVPIVAAAALAACGGDGGSGPAVAAITVAIEALGSTVVPVGSTTQFVATVANDPANLGVSWTVACAGGTGVTDCGTLSPPNSASGATVTYTAPATKPPFTLTVNITAASVSAPAAWGVISVNVPKEAVPLTTVIMPYSVLLPLDVSQDFVATVYNDADSQGLVWTLLQDGVPCAANCGAISPPTTASGAGTTYTPPALLPAKPALTLTATSVTDPPVSAQADVTLTGGSVKLIPTHLGWGKRVIGATQVASLTNTGSSTLAIDQVSVGGTNPSDFKQTNTCGSSVAPHASCAISVTFSPKSGSSASRTAILSISDSSSDSPQHVLLSGSLLKTVTMAMRAVLTGQTSSAVPRPTGSREVGTRVVHLIDSDRADPYLLNGARRELMVRLWYPASPGTTCNPADYTSPQVWSYFSKLLGVPLPQISTNSCLDAPLAAGPFPLVLFSPGFTATFTDYTFLLEDLASRGYFVAAVDHTYDATAVEFPDGRLEKSLFGSHLTAYTRSDARTLAFAAVVRVDDLKSVVNELQRIAEDGSGYLAGKLDFSHVALVGHSLGGLTTILGVQSDARFKVGVVLDGLVPERLASLTDTPVLTLVAGREQWNEDDCRLWDALRGPRLAVNLPGAEHIALSDAVWLLKGVIKTGDRGPEHAIAAIREYVATFLDLNLRDPAPGSRPSSPVPDFPGAVIAAQGQSLCIQH